MTKQKLVRLLLFMIVGAMILISAVLLINSILPQQGCTARLTQVVTVEYDGNERTFDIRSAVTVTEVTRAGMYLTSQSQPYPEQPIVAWLPAQVIDVTQGDCIIKAIE